MARSDTKAMVRLDTQAIRNKALQAHRKAERALEKITADLKRYRDKDVPGFRAWIHRTFGHWLTRHRELQHAIDEKMAMLGEIEDLIEWPGLSPVEAYRKVMWRRAHPDEAEAEDRAQEEARRQQAQEQASKKPDADFFPDEDCDDEDDLDDDEFDAWLEEMLTQNRKPRDSGIAPADQKTARELYRNIVRRLHPDHHGQMSEAHAALWHEAQEAHRRHDLSALHSILARCDDHAAVLGNHTPVSLILRMTRQLAQAARANRAELRHVKRDAAWQYESRLSDRGFIRKIEQDLQTLAHSLQLTLNGINRDLADLEREANRPQHPRPKRKAARPKPPPSRSSHGDDLPF